MLVYRRVIWLAMINMGIGWTWSHRLQEGWSIPVFPKEKMRLLRPYFGIPMVYQHVFLCGVSCWWGDFGGWMMGRNYGYMLIRQHSRYLTWTQNRSTQPFGQKLQSHSLVQPLDIGIVQISSLKTYRTSFWIHLDESWGVTLEPAKVYAGVVLNAAPPRKLNICRCWMAEHSKCVPFLQAIEPLVAASICICYAVTCAIPAWHFYDLCVSSMLRSRHGKDLTPRLKIVLIWGAILLPITPWNLGTRNAILPFLLNEPLFNKRSKVVEILSTGDDVTKHCETMPFVLSPEHWKIP